MYADDFRGAFPGSIPTDHTLWIKRMLEAKYFPTLQIFLDPAESQVRPENQALRTFSITINNRLQKFIGSYGINERLAGPNGILMPTVQSVKEPTELFFFGCAVYIVSPDWDRERVYNASGPVNIGSEILPPRKDYARHGSGSGSRPGSVVTYVDGHAKFEKQDFIEKTLRWY